MSKESVQFIEMVRQAMVSVRKPVYVRLYCQACHKFTAHQETGYGAVCIFYGHTPPPPAADAQGRGS